MIDAQNSVFVHLEIKELCGICEIDLVDIIVDRTSSVSGKRRHGIAVLREASLPCRTIKAFEIAHQVDLVGACRVTHLGNRVDEDALRSELCRLRADKDSNWGSVARLNTWQGGEADDSRRLAIALRAAVRIPENG